MKLRRCSRLFAEVALGALYDDARRRSSSLLALWETQELAQDSMLLRRGHPGKGKSRKTVVRSVRLPASVWKEVEDVAGSKHLNLHQVMRAALLGRLEWAS